MKRPIFVAEISANHGGLFDTAIHTIQAAAKSGADMVKFQTFTPSQMTGDDSFIIPSGQWKGRDLKKIYEEAHTPREWHKELFDEARRLNVAPFSTPFHPDDVEFLETIGCPMYKISSFEIGFYDLLRAVSKTGKDIVISTGAADYEEIGRALSIVNNAKRQYGRTITLLKCTSSYPAEVKDANLAAMEELRKRFHCQVGVSDHTTGYAVPAAATALGASMIEKHFTLPGNVTLDSKFSLTPHKFSDMVKLCTDIASSIGEPVLTQTDTGIMFKRGLWWDSDIEPGQKIERCHLKAARPAGSIPAEFMDSIVGKTTTRKVKAGKPVNLIDFMG